MGSAFAPERDELMPTIVRASESCSVCLDAVNDTGERSIAKLKCGHFFHLDCIGSAFNVKGSMQCPNCRHVEDGQWLYANGSRWIDDIPIEEIYDEFEPLQFLHPPVRRVDSVGHYDWCPYQHYGNTSRGLSDFFLGERETVEYSDMDTSYMQHESGSASSSPPLCPHLVAQGFLRPRPPTVQPPIQDSSRPYAAHGSSRPHDSSATSDNPPTIHPITGMFTARNRELWGAVAPNISSIPGYSDATPRDATPRVQETRFQDFMWSNILTSHEEMATGGPSLHERYRVRSQQETQRGYGASNAATQGVYCPSEQVSFSRSYFIDRTPPPATNQYGAIGNASRYRSGRVSSPFMASGSGTAASAFADPTNRLSLSFRDANERLDRRLPQPWIDSEPPIGEELPVPWVLDEAHQHFHQADDHSHPRRNASMCPGVWFPYRRPTPASDGLVMTTGFGRHEFPTRDGSHSHSSSGQVDSNNGIYMNFSEITRVTSQQIWDP